MRLLLIFFTKNGYPISIIQNSIKKFLDKLFKGKSASETDTKHIVIVLPYLYNVSEDISKRFKGICKTFNIKDCNIIFNTRKLSTFFPIKTKVPTLLCSLVVYAFYCLEVPGKPIYIGKTFRHLVTRVKEHKSRAQSNIYSHLLECHNHSNFFGDFKIISSARSDFELKIKESLYICKLKPELNIKATNSSDCTLRLFN